MKYNRKRENSWIGDENAIEDVEINLAYTFQ